MIFLTCFPLQDLLTFSHVVGKNYPTQQVQPLVSVQTPVLKSLCNSLLICQQLTPLLRPMLHPAVTASSSKDSWLLRLFLGTPRPFPSPWRSLCSVRQQSCWEAREKLNGGYETLQYDQNVNWRVSALRPAASSFATQRVAEGQAAWESQQNEVLAGVAATHVS